MSDQSVRLKCLELATGIVDIATPQRAQKIQTIADNYYNWVIGGKENNG